MKIVLFGLKAPALIHLANALGDAFEVEVYEVACDERFDGNAIAGWIEEAAPDCILNISNEHAVRRGRLPVDVLFSLNTDLPGFLAGQAGLYEIPLLQMNLRGAEGGDFDSVSDLPDAEKEFNRLWNRSLSEAQLLISQMTRRQRVLNWYGDLPVDLKPIRAFVHEAKLLSV